MPLAVGLPMGMVIAASAGVAVAGLFVMLGAGVAVCAKARAASRDERTGRAFGVECLGVGAGAVRGPPDVAVTREGRG